MRLKHRNTVALLLALVALPQLAAQSAPAPAKKALFWKVTAGENTIYLLGSIHLGSKEMYPLPKEIEDAFDSSSVLVMEVDLTHIDMQKIQAVILSTGMYSGDDLLWDHVGKEARQKIEEFCQKYGFPAERMAKMKPWLAATVVGTLPLAKKGMDPGLGIDKYFADKSGKKRVVEIESAEWQFKLISGFPDELQEKYLAATIQEAAELEEEASRLQEVWLSGDPEKVAGLMARYDHGPPEITKAMLQDRNPHMADVAEQLLKGKERTFVVVGAAHLVGKDGVVRILERRGYKIEQVALGK